MKIFGKFPVFVARKPVLVVETRDDGPDALSDGVEMRLTIEIDGVVRIHRRSLARIKPAHVRAGNVLCKPGCIDALRRRV